MRNEVFNLINRNSFVGLKECESNVLKFYNHHADNNLSTVYVDYSNTIFDSADQALAKHKHIVEEEYFKSEGSLQWNFYYYFVLDKENYNKFKNTKFAKDIENDTNYSRKRVVSIDLLESSYPFSLSVEKIKQGKASNYDLSSEWIKILQANDLDEVYSDEKVSTYNAAIERYLIGTPIKDVDINKQIDTSFEVSSPVGIKQLNLNNYRSFSPNEIFSFADVNLIEGVNGKGKTSLLEAIELLMCGKTYRHEKLPTEDAEISIVYKGSNETESFDPRNIKKFQQRDQFWYGIPATPNRNNLYKSFNRFNFFNTDASYRFSTGDEPKVIWSSFEALALGGKTAELGKRIDGFSARFAEIEKRTKKEIDVLASDVAELVKNKESINAQAKGKDFDYDKTNKTLLKLGASVFLDISSETTMDQVKSYAEKMLNRIKSIESLFSEESDLSLEKVEQYLDENIKLEKILTSSIEDIQKNEVHKRVKAEDLKKSEKNTLLSKRLLQYASHDIAMDLPEFERNLEKNRASYLKNQDILNNINSSDLLISQDDGELINTRIKRCEENITKFKLSKDNLETKIKEIGDKLENIKVILLEIKSLGRRFLSNSTSNSGHSACPLCDTLFEREELEQRIGRVEIASDEFTLLVEEKSKIEIELKNNNELLYASRKLQKVIDGLKPTNDTEQMSVSSVKAEIKRHLDLLAEKVDDLDSEQRKIKMLNDHGFNVEELNSLIKHFSLSSSEDRDSLVENIYRTTAVVSSENEKIKSELYELDKRIENFKDNFYNECPKYISFDFSQEMKKEIFDKIYLIKAAADNCNFLFNELRGIPRSTILRTIYVEISDILEDILSYTTFLARLKQDTLALKQIEIQIEQKTKDKEILDLKFGRAKKAVETFNEISINFGVESAVQKFFSQNKSVILEIFKTIHAPNEFEDIILDDQSIFVLKNGTRRELSTISTGQRTAVALSIFLGMHLSCPMAPKIILLDDPIAFVDDLNVLAVLDFLREVVIKGDRQLFFATANKKLGTLFKRKFDLLGTSFTTLNPSSIQ